MLHLLARYDRSVYFRGASPRPPLRRQRPDPVGRAQMRFRPAIAGVMPSGPMCVQALAALQRSLSRPSPGVPSLLRGGRRVHASVSCDRGHRVGGVVGGGVGASLQIPRFLPRLKSGVSAGDGLWDHAQRSPAGRWRLFTLESRCLSPSVTDTGFYGCHFPRPKG